LEKQSPALAAGKIGFVSQNGSMRMAQTKIPFVSQN